MPTPMQEKRAQRFWLFCLLSLLVCSLVLLLGLFFSFPTRIFTRYVPLLSWSMMFVAFYERTYRSHPGYWLGLAFLGWFTLTRLLLGDTFLSSSYNFFVLMCFWYGVALPFARISDDTDKGRALDYIAVLYVLFFAYMAIGGICCAVLGRTIEIPGTVLSFYLGGTGRLHAMSLNPNPLAGLMNVGLFFSLYLLAKHFRKKWTILPCALAVLIYFLAGSLTASLAALIGRALALGVILCLLAGKLRIRCRWLKAGVLAATLLLGTIVFYEASDLSVEMMASFHPAEIQSAAEEELSEEELTDQQNAEAMGTDRNILEGAGTLHGRTRLYKTVLDSMKENPQVFAIGKLDSEIVNLMGTYKPAHYLHSSFLQTMALMGVPGLLLLLVLCVVIFLAALKVLLDDRLSLGQRVIPTMMLPLVVQGTMESFMYVPWGVLVPGSLMNTAFLLCAGYTLEMARGRRFRDLLKPAESAE